MTVNNVSTRAVVFNVDDEPIPYSQKKVMQWRKNREIRKLEDMYQKFENKFERILKSDYSPQKKYDKYASLLFDFEQISIDKWKTVISFPTSFINKINREIRQLEIINDSVPDLRSLV